MDVGRVCAGRARRSHNERVFALTPVRDVAANTDRFAPRLESVMLCIALLAHL